MNSRIKQDKATFKKIIFMGLALILASSVTACGLLAPSPSPSAPIPPAQPQTATESQPPKQPLPAVEVADEDEWNTVKTFTGKGNEITPPFYISGTKWRITWTIDAEYLKYAVFDLLIYSESTPDTPTKRISYSGNSATDTAYIYEGGQDYHIKVIAANLRNWTIAIQDCATKTSTAPVQITYINYKGRGVAESLKMGFDIVEANEYVEIKNEGDRREIIAGWVLKNISKESASFTFPAHMPCSCSWFNDYESCIEHCVPPSTCALDPHQSIRVYTGEVHPESGGFCFYYSPGDIWDNEEPNIAVLYNSGGKEVSRKSYTVTTQNRDSAGE
jgi:hypothetical protein